MRRIVHMMTAAAATAGLAAIAGLAAAQDTGEAERPEPVLVETDQSELRFDDTDAATVAEAMTGTWRSTGPVAGNQDAAVLASFAPVELAGVGPVLYAEMAREGEALTPFRQVLLHLYRFEGQLRMRTLEFKDPDIKPAIVGASLVPELFPQTVTLDGLYATMDLEIDVAGSGFQGQTPYAYPTTESGAVQMTSEIEVMDGVMATGDRGFGTDGAQLWGGETLFERTESVVTVERWSDGLIEIIFDAGQGEPVTNGDSLAIHYTGRLTDGSMFDSSRTRGQPFVYNAPGQLIEGWLRATRDIREGAAMRVVIPPELGYGSRANARIPADSTLLFDIECLNITRVEPPATDPTDVPIEGE
ncbi:MAG: CpcT/CpeT family chromophore lyase [Planctomycetota bacterium]